VTIDGAAVIGCGLIGKRRAMALEACGVQVRLLHDTNAATALDVQRSLTRQPRIAESVDDVLADPTVQLIVIATSHDALATIAATAVTNDRHVLVEKPAGRDLAGVAHVASLARERGVVVRVGYNHRFHPALLAAKEIVRSGQFGPVLNVRARYGHGGRLGYDREWRARREISGGGELVDQGSHLIDLTRYFCGDVELAFSELRTDFWNMEVEDNAFLALRTSAGAFAWLHASWTEWKNQFSFEIALRDAKVEIVGLGGSYGPERLVVYEMPPGLGPPDITTREWAPGDTSWAAEIRDVLRAIAGESSIGAGIEDATAVFDVIDAAYSA
jgi:predicted dehydrogenase